MEPVLRPDTEDAGIWANVFTLNEYHLPTRMDGWVVLDVGAHIGSFACLAKERGAALVVSVEPDPANFRLLVQNFSRAAGSGVLRPFLAAAWRSDFNAEFLSLGSTAPGHTGNGIIQSPDPSRELVAALPFDFLIGIASGFGRRRVDALKIDCESSEWPILFTAKKLDLIDRIYGEYHAGDFGRFTPDMMIDGVVYSIQALDALLRSEGFLPSIEEPNDYLFNHFWAHRPGITPAGPPL